MPFELRSIARDYRSGISARIARWKDRLLHVMLGQRSLPRRLTRLLLVLGLVSGVSATYSSAQMWPRLIVGIVMPAASAEDAGALVRVRARLVDGTVLEGIRQGCPAIPEVVCSFSFFTTPRDQTVTLIVESLSPGDGHATRDIPLGPFSYQGRDITYVTVSLPSGQPPQIGSPRTISPGPT